MSHQDWTPVVIHKKKSSSPDGGQVSKSISKPHTRVDDGEIVKPKYIDREFSQQVVKARVEKKLTRKQLAQMLNITETVVADVETGNALHNGPLVDKLRRCLDIKK